MTEIKSKNDFAYYAGKLNTEIADYSETTLNFQNFVSGLEAVDGIDPAVLGRSLCNGLQNLANEGQSVANNITNYIKTIEELDQYDRNIDVESKSTTNSINPNNPTSNIGQTNNIENANVLEIIKTTNLKSENGITPQSSKTDIKTYKGAADIDTTKYKNDKTKGFEVTTGNIAYQLSEEDQKILTAIVASQSDQQYDDALAVTSMIFNRSENPSWMKLYGRDPMLQATAKDQFIVYSNGYYKTYLNNVPQQVSSAVKDCLNGVRNHKFLYMNSYPEFSNYFISATGNRYK